MWIFYISGIFQDIGNDINLRVTDKILKNVLISTNEKVRRGASLRKSVKIRIRVTHLENE